MKVFLGWRQYPRFRLIEGFEASKFVCLDIPAEGSRRFDAPSLQNNEVIRSHAAVESWAFGLRVYAVGDSGSTFTLVRRDSSTLHLNLQRKLEALTMRRRAFDHCNL